MKEDGPRPATPGTQDIAKREPAAGGKPFGAKPFDTKSFGDRPTGPRPERSFEPRAAGEGSAEVKPFAKPFAKPGAKPFGKSAHAGASGAPARDGKPFGKREDRPAGKAFGKPFAKAGGKPRPAGSGAKTFGGKPSFNRGDVKRAA